jgi:hypothetical protein
MLLTNGLAAAGWIPPDLARPMRQIRTFAERAAAHTYAAFLDRHRRGLPTAERDRS